MRKNQLRTGNGSSLPDNFVAAIRETIRDRIAELGVQYERQVAAAIAEMRSSVDREILLMRDRVGPPGPQGPQGEPGSPGSIGAAAREWQHRGVFNPERTYEILDVVAKDGGSFLAIAEDPGECPGPGWALLAGRGKKGEKGDPA